MKILHVNTQAYGGAAKACIRLHLGLLDRGADSHILFLYQPRQALPQTSGFAPEVPNPDYPSIGQRISRRFRQWLAPARPAEPLSVDDYIRLRPNGAEVFSRATSAHDLRQQPAYQQADIVHLHWVAGLADYPSLFADHQKQFVWTLHDLNPFTGGCHYDEGCGRFKTDCGTCPQLKDTDNPAFAHASLVIKRAALAGHPRLTIVSPSAWLLEQSGQSALLAGRPHHLIANGVDGAVFRPTPKAEARTALGLPTDKPVLLFVADYIQSRRKGFGYLAEAHHQLGAQAGAFTWAVVAQDSQLAPPPFHPLGGIDSEAKMSLAYSAADALVIPSREDNLPNTIVEAMLCGTPAIGFAVGGIASMIAPGQSGYLCPEVSSAALAQTILAFARDQAKFVPSQIREMALGQYDLAQQAERYLQLYQQLYRA
jgi:glycosyltransferase involved in cell wall biosynthesis